MNDVGRLRNLVSQLLALAIKARENGDDAFADELVAKALKYDDRAKALEAINATSSAEGPSSPQS